MSGQKTRVAARNGGHIKIIRDKRTLVVVSLALGSALSSLDQDIVSTAMPTIVGELGDRALYGWVFTAYMIASAIALVVFSRLSDFYGTKGVFAAGLALFLAGSILGGLANSMGYLVAYRFLQGIGGGIMIVLPLVIVAQLYPKEEWGKWQGLMFAAFGLGNLLGPVLGGVLTQYVDWRWVFWINVPLSAVALMLVGSYRGQFGEAVRDRTAPPALTGIFLFVLSLGASLLAIDQLKAPDRWWLSVLLLALGSIAGIWFLRRQAKTPPPLIPLRALRGGVVPGLLLVSFLVSFSMIGAAAYVPLYIQGVKGFSPAASGVIVLPIIATAVLSSLAAGAVLSRLGNPRVLLAVVLAALVVSLGLISTVTPETSLWLIILYGSLLGVGIGGSLPVTMVLTQTNVAPEHLATGTSMQTFVRTLGASAGLAVAGAIIAAAGGEGVMGPLRWIFVIETAAALVALVVWGVTMRLNRLLATERVPEDPAT